MPVGAET